MGPEQQRISETFNCEEATAGCSHRGWKEHMNSTENGAYRIDEDACTGCGVCLTVCPTGAIYVIDGKAAIDGTRCVRCGECARICPKRAIRVKEIPVTREDPVGKKPEASGSFPSIPAGATSLLFTVLSNAKNLFSPSSPAARIDPRRTARPRRGRGHRKRCGGRTRRWH